MYNHAYDDLNRLTDGDGILLRYDAEGRVINTENPGMNFSASYDDAGRLQTVSYNNGAFTVTYTYDPETGLLSSVSDDLTHARVDFIADDDLRPIAINRSNGVNTTLTWDEARRLVGPRDGNILDLRYTLDAAGQVIREERTVPLDSVDLLVGQAASLSYDAASQVNSAGMITTHGAGSPLRWARRSSGMAPPGSSELTAQR